MNIIYEKTNEDSYIGGFSLVSHKNVYLGGNYDNIHSRYENMVTPFGLYYKNHMHHLNNEADNEVDYEINYDVDNNYLDENEYNNQIMYQDTECIKPELFDKLFYIVGNIEMPKREKYNNKKTRKNKKK